MVVIAIIALIRGIRMITTSAQPRPPDAIRIAAPEPSGSRRC
jgi:hypothetical protein